MFKSKEIRWFKDSSDKAILDWFVGLGQSFENTCTRTDYYLPLDKDDISVKLREGNIEIKHRIGHPQKRTLIPNCTGSIENWIKWSFNADKSDQLTQEIVSHNPYEWIETIKTRIGVKVTEDSNGKLQILPIKSFVDFGCQIEYTLLKIDSNSYFTFALEWFGEKELQLPEELVKEIIGTTQLNLGDSMGYGEYLNSNR